MSDNRTQKDKDQKWLGEVVKKVLFLKDNYSENMQAIFCYENHGSGGMLFNATPSFQMRMALKLIRSFQNETGASTSEITDLIKDNLNEA